MEKLCPKCQSVLTMHDADTAVCPNCNKRYRVVRRSATPATQPAAPAVSPNPYAVAPEPPPVQQGIAASRLATTTMEMGVTCGNHPGVPAITRCRECRTPVCSTCDFPFPGGIHLCPKCATSTSKKLSPKRKALVGWSYALAVWGTVGMAMMLGGVFADSVQTQKDAEQLSVMLALLIALPTFIGAVMSFACLDKRLGNPLSVIAVAVWNGILLGVWIFLSILGMMQQ